MKPGVKAQLHSSSGRSSKIIKDHTHIETVVEVAGVGKLVLDVNSGGGYSLRAYPERNEDPSRDLLAVGVVHADEIVAINPEGLSAVDGEQGAEPPSEVLMCEASVLPYASIQPSAWKSNSRKFTVASILSGAAAGARPRHFGTPSRPNAATRYLSLYLCVSRGCNS
jgi:hypothetical protein